LPLALGMAVTVFSFGVAIFLATGLVTDLGKNIPQLNLGTDYSYGAIVSFLILAGMFFLPFPRRHRLHLGVLWMIRSCVTLLFMLFYEARYDFLDAYSYFDVPRRASYQWQGIVPGGGTENIYSAIHLLYQALPESYHALKVLFSLFGLGAAYLFYRASVRFLGREDIRILYLIGLFPSILFWSSILGKDPLSLFGIALYTYGVVSWYRGARYSGAVWIALGAVFAMLIRFWLLSIMLAPLALVEVARIKRGYLVKLLLAAGICAAIAFSLQSRLQDFKIETTTDALARLKTASTGWSGKGGSAQEITADFSNPKEIVMFLPVGMFTALFRPLPGEVMNVFGFLSGIENFILLLLLVKGLFNLSKRDLRDPVLLWAVLFILVWSSVYGFFSYQNLGTAVRFRLQVLPALLGTLLYIGARKGGARKGTTKRHSLEESGL